ncbi:MAG: acyl carrier protein [Pseudomonadota bacterium]
MQDARDMLAEAVGAEPASIPKTAAIGDLAGWDSLAHMRLIAAMEARLARPLTTEEMLEVTSLETIHKVLSA